MATRTSTKTGVASDSTVWGGALANGDIVVVATGHKVTFDADYTLGSKASGVGIGITVNGTDATTFGDVDVNPGVSLTLRGFDATTNRMALVNRWGKFRPTAGTIIGDVATDWSSQFTNNGYFAPNGAAFTIPSGNITWSNAGSKNLGTISGNPFSKTPDIYLVKLITGTNSDPGPVSNSGGTALGSLADSSFAVTSGSFGGTAVEVAIGSDSNPTVNLASNGNYCIDYNKGMLWYKSASGQLTVAYSFKYATWPSWGVVSTNNQTGSTHTPANCTFSYMGSWGSTQGEYTQGCMNVNDKYAPAVDATRAFSCTGNTFNHCAKVVQLHNSNTAGSESTSLNRFSITGNTFNHCHWLTTDVANFADGIINLGYSSYVDVTGNTFNSATPLFTQLARGTPIDINVSSNTGRIFPWKTLPNGSVASTFDSNVWNCFGGGLDNPLGAIDPCLISVPGDLAHGRNVYTKNTIGNAHRIARVDNYMTIGGSAANRNTFYRAYHHGFVFRASDGYIDGSTITLGYDVIYDSFDSNLTSTTAAGGGLTTGYNRALIIDGVTVDHCTFDGSNRSIQFMDYENSVSGVVRCTVKNCILSNNQQGIRLETGDSTNQSNIGMALLDNNNDYGNSTNTSNIKQGTFMMSGANYVTGTRNAVGCDIFSPSYSLPDATNRTLNLTVAGTSGTNKSLKVDWGGGAQVDFVAFQGTADSATNPGGGPATITKAAAGFTTAGAGLKSYWVMIVGGTGSGQWGMIKSNTATVLTIIPKALAGNWTTTPDNTSVYLVIKPHQTITDSGVGTILCQIHPGLVTTTNGTYTDNNITIAKNYPGTTGVNNGVNPSYVAGTVAGGGNFAPTNSLLSGVASDGTYIGAYPVFIAGGGLLTMGVG